jgi:hypothetical protein
MFLVPIGCDGRCACGESENDYQEHKQATAFHTRSLIREYLTTFCPRFKAASGRPGLRFLSLQKEKVLMVAYPARSEFCYCEVP